WFLLSRFESLFPSYGCGDQTRNTPPARPFFGRAWPLVSRLRPTDSSTKICASTLGDSVSFDYKAPQTNNRQLPVRVTWRAVGDLFLSQGSGMEKLRNYV